MGKWTSTGISSKGVKHVWVLAKVSIRSRGVGVNRARKKWLPDSHFRDWVDYKDGFGDFKLWNDEFWLGNDHIHSVLSEGQKRLTTPPLISGILSF